MAIKLAYVFALSSMMFAFYTLTATAGVSCANPASYIGTDYQEAWAQRCSR